MPGTTVRVFGGVLLVSTLALLVAVSYELASSSFSSDAFTPVTDVTPLSGEILAALVVVLGVLTVTVMLLRTTVSTESIDRYDGE